MKPIDFQGVISLDQSLVEDLKNYLQEKESQLSKSIIYAIHPLPRESLPPVLPYSTAGGIKIADAISAFTENVERIRKETRQIVPSDDWLLAVRQINNALWEYVEVLEGSVTELFQSLSQIGFEKWRKGLMEVVTSIKDLLSEKLEGLTDKIPQLETLLWEYRFVCEARDGKSVFFMKFLYFWKTLLDRSLRSYLRKSKKYLKTRYQWFDRRYNNYLDLNSKIENSLRKFNGYQVFKSIDDHTQKGFRKIYKLLKIWQLNENFQSLPSREPVRALRSAFSIDKASKIFKEYYNALKAELFERSRKFKKDSKETYLDVTNRRFIAKNLKSVRAEVHTLGVNIGRYREFFLRTHPNPYIRTRFGFTEWVVGPEPQQTKELLHQIYRVETLDKLFENLEESLKKGPAAFDNASLRAQYRECQRHLHELGQPLTAKHLLKTSAERFLHQLGEMTELGSFNPKVTDSVGKLLSKALRADWKYHVLFDFPLFHQLYRIHQGILGQSEDRNHLARMHQFKDLIAQIQQWVKKRDTYRHVHEIETDMSDMKGSLQKFLAQLQHLESEENVNSEKRQQIILEFAKQLLEYRYLFGNFFHFLNKHEPEGKWIRNQFLFVDQYFESVEMRLASLKDRIV